MLPGLTTPPGQTAEEIGYDDDSIEAFESDTGIRLNLPVRGRERFEKRYALLNGPHYNAWYAWRSRKMREKTSWYFCLTPGTVTCPRRFLRHERVTKR